MKIYFTASARGKKLFEKNYHKIFQTIADLGHKNLDDLIFNIDPNNFYEDSRGSKYDLFEETLKKIKDSEVVILEVSIPSLSMGFVLQKALEINKPVIALYQTGSNPVFASKIDDDKLQVLEYNKGSLKRVVASAIDYAKDRSDVRFNFFISPKIVSYLDWIAKQKRIPRSVYLRRLIERDMKSSDFQASS